MRFISLNGITLHYTLEGPAEGEPLVFINSLGSDLRLWHKLIPHFAGHFPILRYDKRGHGLSDSPPGPYTIRDHANDLAALLEQLQVEQAILIGISVGGMIALDYALNNPERVEALIVSDTGAKIGTSEFWNERIEAIKNKGLAGLAETILGRWFAPAFAEQHPAEYRGYYNMLTRMPVAGYIATCQSLQNADLRESVSAIQAKTLVLCGAEDLATPPQLGRELAAALPNARFELIEQAAHLPCLEQPEAMAAKINQFLQENGYV
jgi:3-oxoadipate enol-lactonase